MALLSLLLLVSVNAGFVCLPKGWILSWHFSASKINFSLQLTIDTIQRHDWAGIGFKLRDDPRPYMTGADMVKIIFGEYPQDSYAVWNYPPVPDREMLGEINNTTMGSSDIEDYSFEWETLTYFWTREIDTHDEYDLVLEENSDLKILWATGQTLYGTTLKHYDPDRGIAYVVLSEDFESECQEKNDQGLIISNA